MNLNKPLRILVVASVFPRWEDDSTPPFVFNLCHDLVNAGCRITVLAPHSKGAKIHEAWEGMDIFRFRYAWPKTLQNLCYEGGMIVRLRENPLRSLALPFLAISQWWTIRQFLRKDYDLIHAHSLLPQGLIAAFANKRRLPLVISSHGADVFLLKRKWKWLLRSAVSRSSALIANSSATRDALIKLKARPGSIVRIPATPNFPDPKHPTHDPENPYRLLFVGRLIPEKGVDALVDAMPEILEKFPHCNLRVAGAGVLETHLKERISAQGLTSNVSLLGWLGPDSLRKEMQRAALLVAPSRMIEGQNLVVTEALSVGCPVATTPRGGVLDLVKDGETGFVMSKPEASIIAKKTIHILQQSELLSSVSKKGFEHFHENYSRGHITALTLQLYEDVL